MGSQGAPEGGTGRPSRAHELLAWAVPRVRRSRDLRSEEEERQRVLSR
jgi:hypothetical protein